MILRLLHPGSPTRGPLDDAARDYMTRLARHQRVDEVFVKTEATGRGRAGDVARALAAEGVRLLERVGAHDVLVALVIGGKPRSSEQLAERLDGWRVEAPSAVTFVLGSSHGLHRDVLAKARARWSFGPMTLPHELARVVLWEQLYRADAILRGAPYHK